jgi:MFS family permease
VANSSTLFIVGRAVAGAGGSGVVSGGLSIIASVTTREQRPMFTGLITSLYALGTVIAPLIEGAFTTNVAWRWCFLINLPVCAVTVITLVLFFHTHRRHRGPAITRRRSSKKSKRLDLIGCALFIPSTVMALLSLQWGGGKYL